MDFRRIKALFDTSAWLLIIPAIIALFFVDASMLRTLIEWVIFAPALAGLAIMISRVIFPQIHLAELIESVADENSLPAALLVAAIILFVGMVFFTLVFWSRA